MPMTNAYIAVQRDTAGYWQWRIEAVEGYYPWRGHYATEQAAQAAGEANLGLETRSRLIAESIDIIERRRGRVK